MLARAAVFFGPVCLLLAARNQIFPSLIKLNISFNKKEITILVDGYYTEIF